MQATTQTTEQTIIATQTASLPQTTEAARTLSALELCMVGGGRGSVTLE
jgi:hypothetical protein